MGTLNPLKTLTCHECLQWVEQCQDTIQDNRRHVTTNKDDEEEFLFQGIPIAGENEGDSDDSWDSVDFEPTQNVTFALPLHPFRGIGTADSPVGSLLSKLHLKATEAIAFLVGPVKEDDMASLKLTLSLLFHLPQISTNPSLRSPTTLPHTLLVHHTGLGLTMSSHLRLPTHNACPIPGRSEDPPKIAYDENESS